MELLDLMFLILMLNHQVIDWKDLNARAYFWTSQKLSEKDFIFFILAKRILVIFMMIQLLVIIGKKCI